MLQLLKKIDQSCQRLTHELNDLIKTYRELKNSELESLTAIVQNVAQGSSEEERQRMTQRINEFEETTKKDINTHIQIWKDIQADFTSLRSNIERIIDKNHSTIEENKLLLKISKEYNLIRIKFNESC